MKPKEAVLEYVNSLSPYQWVTYLSYIIQPNSRLPQATRVDLTQSCVGQGRCATVAGFEEAFDEVSRYVDRLCDLKMNFEVKPSLDVERAVLRDSIERGVLLVIKDLDNLSQGLLEEYLSVRRYRVSGSLDVSTDYGLIIYGKVPRRTKYGNPEAATYNKLGRGVYRLLQGQRKAFGFHIVTPDDLSKQVKPKLEPESDYSDSYLVSSYFSRYKERFILDTGIKSIWR